MNMDGDKPAITVDVSDTQAHLAIPAGMLAGLAERVLAREGVGRAALSVALVDNTTIQDVNRRFLGHDWPTDVISFVLSDPGEPELSGELVISAEMAAQSARDTGGDPLTELALYLVHGVLHLCGYDDQTEAGVQLMRRREAEILAAEGWIPRDPTTGSPRAEAAGREPLRW